ncbi:MAG: DUF6034 family protein, partial [Bacteroides sp.]|nr:DUF6034 family protein [Bacteroides sp.]
MIRRRIKQAAFGMSLLSILMMTGCLATPDMEYVTNKEGQDSLISNHAVTDNGIPVSQQVHAPERATGSCEKVNEYTSIEVDAKVVVPSATTVPVYTVSPIRMDAEAAEHYTGTLFETGEFYNREYGDTTLSQELSLEDIYEEIEALTITLETAEITNAPEPVLDEEGNVIEMDEEYAQLLSDRLAFYQEILKDAEERPTYGSEVSYDFEAETSKIVVPQRQGNGYVLDVDGETVDYEFQSLCFTGRHN